MKAKIFLVAGIAASPLIALASFFLPVLAWLLCPPALTVYFLRQAAGSFDSIGAPGLPDIAVALLYFPLIGWLLFRSKVRGKLKGTVERITVWHGAFILFAFMAEQVRNTAWGF